MSSHLRPGLKALLFCLAVMCCFPLRSGLAATAGDIVQVQDEMNGVLISGSIQTFYHDHEGQMKLEDILELSIASFAPVADKIPYFGITKAAIWSRFVMRNEAGHSISAVLEYSYPNTDYIDFYVPNEHGYQKRQSGDQVDPRVRDISYRLPVFRFEVPPGEHVYYLRVKSNGLTQFPLRLYSRDLFYEKRTSEGSFMAFFFGFLTVMAFYNIFLGLTTRNRIYISYVAFNLVSILNYIGIQGFFNTLLPPALVPFFNNEVTTPTVGIMAATAVWFTSEFLVLKHTSKRLYIMTMLPGVLGLAGAAMMPVDFTLGVKITAVSVPLTSLAIAVAAVFRCFQRYRPAYFFTVSWAVLLLSTLVFFASNTGFIPQTMFTSMSQFVGSSLEVVLLSLAVGDKMRLRQLKSDQEIRELNEGLERKVEEKTRDIRSMLESIRLGIFSVVGQKLLVDHDYSKHLEEIVHEKSLQGKSAMDVIFRNSDASADEIAVVQSTLCAAIGEDVLAFDSNEEGFIHEIKVNDPVHGERILELEWNPMINKQNITEKVLVVMKDVTEIRRSKAQTERQRIDVQYMTELVAVPADRVERFFKMAAGIIEENKRLLQGPRPDSPEVVSILFINVHTLKGTSRAFGFKDLNDVSHHAEQALADIRQGKRAWDTAQLMEDVDGIQALLKTYLSINTEKLNRTSGQQMNLMITRADMKAKLELLDKMGLAHDPSQIHEGIMDLRNYIVRLLYSDIREFLEEFRKPIEKLAGDLEKESPNFILDLDDIHLSDTSAEVLRNIFMHAIRNSLDHGIEHADERLSAGKPRQGCIAVSARAYEDRVIVTFKDDGRGLAMRKIEQLAMIKGLIPERHELDRTAIANLVFHSGFTTTTSVSDISGRGVGMDAIRAYLEKIGGSIKLKLMDTGPIPMPDFIPFALEIQLSGGFYQIQRRDAFLAKAG